MSYRYEKQPVAPGRPSVVSPNVESSRRRRSSSRSRRKRRSSSRRRRRNDSPQSSVKIPPQGSVAYHASGGYESPVRTYRDYEAKRDYEVWPPVGMVWDVDINGEPQRRPPSPPKQHEVRQGVRTVKISNLSDPSTPNTNYWQPNNAMSPYSNQSPLSGFASPIRPPMQFGSPSCYNSPSTPQYPVYCRQCP
eukprot:TRINITY_DN5646_c0_g1_i4.p1 TRINITY_DN5646_c0_g1~~TRINITY_DN5646_c0_g1_i4.p1  ORF type:complete len:192 (+),score=18.63 TRINITY_DN5646_c0_g1_i4:33-608(+)